MAGRRGALVVVVAVAAALGFATAALLDEDDDDPGRRGSTAHLRTVAPPAVPSRPSAPAAPAPPLGARILRRVQLRSRPGGRVVRTVGTHTGFGSVRVLGVVARRGRWLGVLSDHVSNSRAAWVPADAVELLHEPYRLDVDLSARRVTVRREGRVVRRIRVAIGKPGTPTPTGRFAVTDVLRIGRGRAQYGCCAIALTARQPNVPQGWSGGDRIAIHGTTARGSIGTPASNGCLRAGDADMRWLIKRIRLGAPVRIRA